MLYITPTEEQQHRIERWLAVAKRKSVYVVDDGMIASKNADLRNWIEIMVLPPDQCGHIATGRYNRTIQFQDGKAN